MSRSTAVRDTERKASQVEAAAGVSLELGGASAKKLK